MIKSYQIIRTFANGLDMNNHERATKSIPEFSGKLTVA